MKTKEVKGYEHVTPVIVKQVRAVVAEAAKHVLSVSRIYGAHNAVFQKKEQGETCASCLKTRAENLRQWLAVYDGEAKHMELTNEATIIDDQKEGQGFADYNGNKHETLAAAILSNEKIAEGGDADTGHQSVGPGPAAYVGANGENYIDAHAAEAAGQLKDEDSEAKAAATPPAYVPAEGSQRIDLKEGERALDIVFDANKPNKGKAKFSDGGNIKPGKYETANGDTVSVGPGGVITYTVAEANV